MQIKMFAEYFNRGKRYKKELLPDEDYIFSCDIPKEAVVTNVFAEVEDGNDN